MPTLADIVDDTDQRAEAIEDEYRRLALTLFAFELAFILAMIHRAGADAAIVNALRAAVQNYRAPEGLFRKRWEDDFGQLMRDNAIREARRAIPVVGGSAPATVRLPRQAQLAIEQHAVELADAVVTTSALKVEAAAVAISQKAAPAPDALDQRLESLVPLVGRRAAEEIMATVRAGANQSLAKVATSLTRQVHSTEVTTVRAERIARTESIGVVNLTKYEQAIASGVLREKRWLHQGDDRVRESHIACGAEGWIPIANRFSNGLRYPGERPAPAEEVINCRCALAFRAFGAPDEPVAPRGRITVPPEPATPDPKQRSVLEGGERDTLAENTVDGKLTPERQRLHDQIIDDMFRESGATPVENPQAFQTGGGGASGKSLAIGKMNPPKNVIKIDVDDVRKRLPEWNAEVELAKREGRQTHELMGAYTHEESSLISKRMIERAATGSYNLIIDTVGDSGIDKLAGKVRGYRAGGASVTAAYVAIDYDEAYKRMRARGDRPNTPNTGRYVPAEVLREQHAAVARDFLDAIQRGIFDEFTLWDNSRPLPAEPILVARGRGNQVTILRQDLWDAFVERGKGIAPRPGEK